MKTMGFWNNKGGTGKTSLCFQLVCEFAVQNPDADIYVFDLCPQANLSELFLGGQEHKGGNNLLNLHKLEHRVSIGGYFQRRLGEPLMDRNNRFLQPENLTQFLCSPCKKNQNIPDNIKLIAGDPILELQSNAISTLANAQVPGTNYWAGVANWLNDLIESLGRDHDREQFAFVDMNPSFSMYTQIALASCERIVIPATADDASRRGVQNALSLIYGFELPSEIYKQHNFSAQMEKAELDLPKLHLIVKNRLTQYMTTAKAYKSVLATISSDVESLLKAKPEAFTFNNYRQGSAEVKDFQTAGVVAFARGAPFSRMKHGALTVAGQRVHVNKEQLETNREIVSDLAQKLWPSTEPPA